MESKSPSAPIPLHLLRGSQLIAWLADETFQHEAVRLLHLPAVEPGHQFHCPLPGHTERRPSAAWWHDKDGLLQLHDFHMASGSEWFSLGDIMAAQAYRKPRRLSTAELVTWSLRLVVETGHARPAPVDLPPLPRKHTESMRRVWDGIRLLYGARWLQSPDVPIPLAWDFLAAWCGLSRRHAGIALLALREGGVVYEAACHGLNPTRYLKLYLPGPAPAVREVNP